MLRSNRSNRSNSYNEMKAPEYSDNKIINHEIDQCKCQCGANSEAGFTKRSGGARVNKSGLIHARQKAKYKLERPIISAGMRYYLTEDDMELRVTICHIQGEIRLEPELTFYTLARFRVDRAIAKVKTRIELACSCIAFTVN
jgi:hypothetical protein